MSKTPALPVKGFEPYKEKKGEQYMSKAQLEHFTKLLQVWKQQLLEEAERTVNNMRDEANNYADPADRATQEEEFALELRARDRERKLIRKIDLTLEMIRREDYGTASSAASRSACAAWRRARPRRSASTARRSRRSARGSGLPEPSSIS